MLRHASPFADFRADRGAQPEGHDDIPATIADPEATQPEEWDEEEDGAWEAPQLPNPEFKGPWAPKHIPNPAYKGLWEARPRTPRAEP